MRLINIIKIEKGTEKVNRIFFPAQSAFGCMRITKTGRAQFPFEDKNLFASKSARPVLVNQGSSGRMAYRSDLQYASYIGVSTLLVEEKPLG